MSLKPHQLFNPLRVNHIIKDCTPFYINRFQILILCDMDYRHGKLKCFNNLFIDILIVILHKDSMLDSSYFTPPVHDWQRYYEALRASFTDC